MRYIRRCAECRQPSPLASFRIGQGYSDTCRVCRAWNGESEKYAQRVWNARLRVKTAAKRLERVERERRDFERQRRLTFKWRQTA